MKSYEFEFESNHGVEKVLLHTNITTTTNKMATNKCNILVIYKRTKYCLTKIRQYRGKGCVYGIKVIVREQMHPELDEVDEIYDVDEAMPAISVKS